MLPVLDSNLFDILIIYCLICMQMRSNTNTEAPLLSLNEGKMTLFPLLSSHKEVSTGILVFPEPTTSSHAETGCLSDKWIHIGCEVRG